MQATAAMGQQTASTGTVVVVDDNQALLHTLGMVFRATPFTCVAVADTLAALCAVAEHRPAAVIVDADAGPLLPWQFCALLRQHPDHARILLIVSSNRDDSVERARAAAAGADQFLPKPFSAEDVLALLPPADPEPAA